MLRAAADKWAQLRSHLLQSVQAARGEAAQKAAAAAALQRAAEAMGSGDADPEHAADAGHAALKHLYDQGRQRDLAREALQGLLQLAGIHGASAADSSGEHALAAATEEASQRADEWVRSGYEQPYMQCTCAAVNAFSCTCESSLTLSNMTHHPTQAPPQAAGRNLSSVTARTCCLCTASAWPRGGWLCLSKFEGHGFRALMSCSLLPRQPRQTLNF